MKRGLYFLLALSLGLNAGLLYVRFASSPPQQPPLGPPPQGRPAPRDAEAAIRDHLDGIARRLKLSEGQQAAIRDILEAHMPRMAELRRATTEANRRIGEAFAAPAFDADRFRQRVQEASAARARADSLSAVMLLGEAAVLTPAQRARFAEAAPTIYSNPQSAPAQGGPRLGGEGRRGSEGRPEASSGDGVPPGDQPPTGDRPPPRDQPPPGDRPPPPDRPPPRPDDDPPGSPRRSGG